MLKFEWKNNQISHIYPAPHTGCIGGCDTTFLEMLRINPASVRPGTTQPDSRHQVTRNTRQPTVNTNRTQPTNNRSNSNSNSNSPINVIPVAPAQRNNTTATAPPRQFAPPQPASRVQNPMNNQTRMPVPRSNNSGGGSDTGDNNVLCGCNRPAILLTVRKQNANHGKSF